MRHTEGGGYGEGQDHERKKREVSHSNAIISPLSSSLEKISLITRQSKSSQHSHWLE
jgi:hypothetical protein